MDGVKYSNCKVSDTSINTICLDKSSTYLLWGSNELNLFNVNSQRKIIEKSHFSTATINNLNLNPSNDKFIASSHTLSIWDLNVFKKLKTFSCGSHSSFKIMESKFMTNDLIVSCGYDCTLKFYDTRQSLNSSIFCLKNAKDNLNSLDFFENYLISCASNDGSLYTYDLRKGLLFSDSFENGCLIDVSLFGDSSPIAAITFQDSKLKLFDLEKSKDILDINLSHSDDMLNYKINNEIVRHRDQKYVISGSESGHVNFYDTVDATKFKSLSIEHKKDRNVLEDVLTCVKSGQESVYASSGDGFIHTWNSVL